MEKTLINMLETSAEKWPNKPLMWENKTDKFEPSSYQEIRNAVHEFGAGLMQFDLKP